MFKKSRYTGAGRMQAGMPRTLSSTSLGDQFVFVGCYIQGTTLQTLVYGLALQASVLLQAEAGVCMQDWLCYRQESQQQRSCHTWAVECIELRLPGVFSRYLLCC